MARAQRKLVLDHPRLMDEVDSRFAAVASRLPSGPVTATGRNESGEEATVVVDTFTVVSMRPPLVAIGVPREPAGPVFRESAELTIRLKTESGSEFRCSVKSVVPAGEQELVIGRVEAIEGGDQPDRRPLLFNHSGTEHLVGHLPSQLPPVESPPPGQLALKREAPAEPLATIVVVGGGAAGTLTAVQLLRRSASGLRVVLVEKNGRAGPGVAYGTKEDQHRLNVPAGQMIGLPDRPFDFLEWVRSENPETQPQEYLARQTFGRYLTDLLDRTVSEASGAFFEQIPGEVTEIDPGERGGQATVRLDDGREIKAERVVLALGNGQPVIPAGIDPEVVRSDHFVADPWSEGALDLALTDDVVLLIGTGLTMVDMAISLGGPGGPDIRAVSRHGLLPRAHGDTMPVRGRPVALPEDRCSLTELTSRLLTEIAVAGARGADWRVAFDSLRPITNDLWKSLDRRDQKRFVSDLGRIWGVHRHRMAPRVALRLERLKVNRRLRVRAASIQRMAIEKEKVVVDIRLNNVDAEEQLIVDRVINCTGPSWDPRRLEQPLVKDLLEKGLLRADALGIGFDVDDDGALIDSEARPSEKLFAIGPPRNGVLLETTAIPEIGQQAELLADLLLSDLAGTLGGARALSAA